VPDQTSTATPPWRKPQRIDQLIDHGAVATFGALLQDGREAQVSPNQRVRMNDFDEFAEIALAIFLVLTLLIWVLTYLERALTDPASQHRNRPRADRQALELRGMRCQPNQVRCHGAAAAVLSLGVLWNHSHITGDS
jgi:hypothetical protein